jgi:glycosyltransferase involved in cell wall biosynthesis
MRRPLVWVAWPGAACVFDRLPRAGVVYQLSDSYTALESDSSSLAAQMEATVARRADLVVCSSVRLLERAQQLYGCGEYVDHGVDVGLFDSALRRPRTPPELQAVPHPVIGFFGNIDGNTLDRSLLEEVIGLRPQYRFVLVGGMTSEFEGLRRYSNVVAVPRQPYRAVADYGAGFDVCLMPWRQNDWIAHCNPVKLKEYLALGKPVVSTPFPELGRYGALCYVAQGADDFASAIDRALQEDNPSRQAERRAWVAQHSWDSKFARVLELLEARGIRPDVRSNARS